MPGRASSLTWKAIHDELRGDLREANGRERDPSAGTIDSPTVKTSFQAGERGFDAAKKTKGRKRHLLVDVLGLVILAVVHPVNILKISRFEGLNGAKV